MSRRLSWFLAVVLWLGPLAGCEVEKSRPFSDSGPSGGDVPGTPDAVSDAVSPPPAFAAPEGVAVAGGYAFVANAAFRFGDSGLVFDEGFVTVVRLNDFQVVNRIPTTAKNPQAVVASGGQVVVLCSGATIWDQATGVVSPASDGAIEILDVAEAPTATAATRVIPLPIAGPGSLVGYPSSLAVTPDGRVAYAGSGTAAAVFKVDLQTGQVLRGSDDPISLGDLAVQDSLTVENGPPGVLLVGSFNRDLVFALDTGSDTPAAAPFQQIDAGKTADMDGVLDLAYRSQGTPDLFALLGIANAVQSATTLQGQASVQTLATTGVYPNRIALWAGQLLILNSGDNNVTAVDIATRQDLGAVAVFPAGANPYDMAVAEWGGRTMLYVTGLASNTLYEVDLQAKTVTRQVP